MDTQKREKFIADVNALPEDSELYYIDGSGFDEYYSREYGFKVMFLSPGLNSIEKF